MWDVAGLDYVAEEYFLTGRAEVYRPVSMADAVDMTLRNAEKDSSTRDFNREVLSADQPFTTRVVVYKPKSARRFSGNVIIETLHPSAVAPQWYGMRCTDFSPPTGTPMSLSSIP